MEDGILNLMDLNMYLDVILAEILQHAGTRMVVISCFNPDACLMYVMVVVTVEQTVHDYVTYNTIECL